LGRFSCVDIMYVGIAAIADAVRILVDDFQFTVVLKCFFIHQREIIRLGIPAIKWEAIRPKTPYMGVRIRLRIIPVMKDIIASLRRRLVFPWLFSRFPVLRDPRAV